MWDIRTRTSPSVLGPLWFFVFDFESQWRGLTLLAEIWIFLFDSACDQAWQMGVHPSGESNVWVLLVECTYTPGIRLLSDLTIEELIWDQKQRGDRDFFRKRKFIFSKKKSTKRQPSMGLLLWYSFVIDHILTGQLQDDKTFKNRHVLGWGQEYFRQSVLILSFFVRVNLLESVLSPCRSVSL